MTVGPEGRMRASHHMDLTARDLHLLAQTHGPTCNWTSAAFHAACRAEAYDLNERTLSPLECARDALAEGASPQVCVHPFVTVCVCTRELQSSKRTTDCGPDSFKCVQSVFSWLQAHVVSRLAFVLRLSSQGWSHVFASVPGHPRHLAVIPHHCVSSPLTFQTLTS